MRLSLIGESSSDLKYVDTVCQHVGDGKIISVNDYPKVGDYGVCEFVVEFSCEMMAMAFKNLAVSFGFQFS